MIQPVDAIPPVPVCPGDHGSVPPRAMATIPGAARNKTRGRSVFSRIVNFVQWSYAMSLIEMNKTVVKKFYDTLVCGNFSSFDTIVAENYEHNITGLPSGRENLKAYFRAVRAAIPDLDVNVLALLAEHDQVAVLTNMGGTLVGDFGPIKATGGKVMVPVFHLYRIQNGLLVQHHEVADLSAFRTSA